MDISELVVFSFDLFMEFKLWMMNMFEPCVDVLFGIVLLALMLYRKIPLWFVFLVVGSFIAVLIGGFPLLFNAFYAVSISCATWDLVVIMYLISVLVSLYRESGFIDKLGRELVYLLRRPRLISMFTPAILGLLPVPGGALMSAPIVDRVGNYIGLDRVRKLFINVWFRHVIFIVYPLSTVLVLTASLTGVDLWDLVLKQLPIALSMVLVGYVIGFPHIRSRDSSFTPEASPDKHVLFKTFLPITVSIVFALALSPFLDYRLGFPFNRLSMIMGVSLGILLLMLLSGSRISVLGRIMRSKNSLELALIGYTAMFMRVVFQSIDLTCLSSYFAYIDPTVLVVVFPAILSSIVGVASSGVAISIPILSSLVDIDLEKASLIYISAFLGYLGSPLHLCYIYTAHYMKTSIVKGYRYMVPSILATIALTLIIYTIL